jgi:hypothetical protein
MALGNDCNCQQSRALAGLNQAEEGAAVATFESDRGNSWMRSVGLGVATGITVWFITRFLDGKFTSRSRR